jgi:hypothetical protein
MSDFEFGDWVDTKPKTEKRKYVRKEVAPVEVTETRLLSNACMLELHNMCGGTLYSYNRRSYVACECDCGDCSEFRKNAAIQEIIAAHNSWRVYSQQFNNVEEVDPMDVYQAAWLAAKEYYNG